MDTRGTEGKGTENRISGPTSDSVGDASDAQSAVRVAQKVSAAPTVSDNQLLMKTKEEIGTSLAEALTKGMTFERLLTKLHVEDILTNWALYTIKELSLPPDDLVRMAFADGYAATVAALAFQRDVTQVSATGWRNEYVDAFENGKAGALDEVAASPPLTEAMMFEMVFKGKARSLNLKPAVSAHSAAVKRKERYGG